jgi:hypothetical protein
MPVVNGGHFFWCKVVIGKCSIYSFFTLTGIQMSSSDSGLLFLYFSPSISKCGLLSNS